jgi:hypothetical protein
MAQYSIANNSYGNSTAKLFDVVMLANSSGGIQDTSAGGSTGSDYSANKPTLPNVGANFAASGVYASYFLVTTVPANSLRSEIEVFNVSGNQVALILDDGTAASSAAPNNATIFALAGGSSNGAQGGSWISQTFKGRVQVYAPANTAFVAVSAR